MIKVKLCYRPLTTLNILDPLTVRGAFVDGHTENLQNVNKEVLCI